MLSRRFLENFGKSAFLRESDRSLYRALAGWTAGIRLGFKSKHPKFGRELVRPTAVSTL